MSTLVLSLVFSFSRFLLLSKKRSKTRAHAQQTLDELLDDVCRMLKYDDDGAGKLKDKANAFFEEETLLTTLAVLQTVTEPMLVQAKLRVLWPYVINLQDKVSATLFLPPSHFYS